MQNVEIKSSIQEFKVKIFDKYYYILSIYIDKYYIYYIL